MNIERRSNVFSRMQWRIAIPYTALIALCLLGLSAYLAYYFRQLELDQLRAQLVADARLVGEVVAPSLSGADATVQVQPLAARLGNQLGARVTIVDRAGVVLGDSHEQPSHMDNHAGRPEIAEAIAYGAGESTRHSATVDRDLLYVAVPITLDGALLGVARVALPLDAVNAALNRVLIAAATAVVVTVVVGVGLALWIAGSVTDPLRRLTGAARRMARGHLGADVSVSGGGEIALLADAFNRMAAELNVQMERLAHQRDVLASVLANLADGIVLVNRSGSVLVTNAAARRLLGLVEAPEGLSLARVVRDHEICQVLEQALGAGPRQVEIARRGPPTQHLRVVAAPLSDGSGGLLVLRDVSEERRVESLRREFVANVSHELRTPIASLKALVETLEHGALDDPPAARDFVGRMHVEVDGLAQLVQELLELSQVESGQAELRPEPVDPSELAHAAAERLRPQADRAGVQLGVEASPGLPPMLADRTRVEQVLLALVHNAVKFTPPGGSVTVAVEAEDGAVRVSVLDTGVGIPPDDLPRIFERFYKVDRARSARGTGLGLAIAKHVVQAHGGRIWAESEPGKGTAVRFALPTG